MLLITLIKSIINIHQCYLAAGSNNQILIYLFKKQQKAGKFQY